MWRLVGCRLMCLDYSPWPLLITKSCSGLNAVTRCIQHIHTAGDQKHGNHIKSKVALIEGEFKQKEMRAREEEEEEYTRTTTWRRRKEVTRFDVLGAIRNRTERKGGSFTIYYDRAAFTSSYRRVLLAAAPRHLVVVGGKYDEILAAKAPTSSLHFTGIESWPTLQLPMWGSKYFFVVCVRVRGWVLTEMVLPVSCWTVGCMVGLNGSRTNGTHAGTS